VVEVALYFSVLVLDKALIFSFYKMLLQVPSPREEGRKSSRFCGEFSLAKWSGISSNLKFVN
jgi:hypothetical protein